MDSSVIGEVEIVLLLVVARRVVFWVITVHNFAWIKRQREQLWLGLKRWNFMFTLRNCPRSQGVVDGDSYLVDVTVSQMLPDICLEREVTSGMLDNLNSIDPLEIR